MSTEKKLLINCPIHVSPVARTDLPDGDVRVFCRYAGCEFDWTFEAFDCKSPSCKSRQCSEHCWIYLKVREVYTDGTALASCTHGCRSIFLRRRESEDSAVVSARVS